MKSFSNDLPNQDKNRLNRIEDAVVSHKKYLFVHFAISAIFALISITTLIIVLLKH